MPRSSSLMPLGNITLRAEPAGSGTIAIGTTGAKAGNDASAVTDAAAFR